MTLIDQDKVYRCTVALKGGKGDPSNPPIIVTQNVARTFGEDFKFDMKVDGYGLYSVNRG